MIYITLHTTPGNVTFGTYKHSGAIYILKD